jgi:DivIVA domain-containing protein
MSFPSTSGGIPGYSPEQVDVLMGRLERQYADPTLRLITSETLGIVKFDLVPGGYQIPTVDSAIARMAEVLLEREFAAKISRGDRDKVESELSAALREIKKVIDAGPHKVFSKARGGYSKGQVKKLVRKLELRRGSIRGADSMELRIASFKRSISGFNRAQVDEFLTLVIRAIHAERALG